MNSGEPMRLPWSGADVPHAVLDILRGCNIRCRDCYNLLPARAKSLAEIESELTALMRARRLQSVSIVGGEITLHPQLPAIVRTVRRRGLFVELFSNGVQLNSDRLTELRQAGANVVFLHLESQQRRPDLPPGAGPTELRRLRTEKCALAARHGFEVGLAVTIHPDHLEELDDAVEFVLTSPHTDYLLVTFWRDVQGLSEMSGNLDEGFVPSPASPAPLASPDHSPAEVRRRLAEHHELHPFAFLGSNVADNTPRWLSYMVASVHRAGHRTRQRSLRPTWFEREYLKWQRRLTGRYPFYQPAKATQKAAHLVINGAAGGGLARNLSLLARASRPGARLGIKRLLFQWPAEIDAAGRVIHCAGCPDAVMKAGALVPLCVSDRVVRAARPAVASVS